MHWCQIIEEGKGVKLLNGCVVSSINVVSNLLRNSDESMKCHFSGMHFCLMLGD